MYYNNIYIFINIVFYFFLNISQVSDFHKKTNPFRIQQTKKTHLKKKPSGLYT